MREEDIQRELGVLKMIVNEVSARVIGVVPPNKETEENTESNSQHREEWMGRTQHKAGKKGGNTNTKKNTKEDEVEIK